MSCLDCGFSFTLQVPKRRAKEALDIEGALISFEAKVGPIERDTLREPGRRCAEAVLRSMRAPNVREVKHGLTAAQWFALAATEEKRWWTP